MNSGSYLLIIRVSKRSSIRVGRLGTVGFQRGWYAYAGSAMQGLKSRISRHQRPAHAKKRHWHIDYLLECGAARLVESWAYPSDAKLECRLNGAVLELPGARPAARGFGSSDCSRCEAHLAYFPKKPDLARLEFQKGTRL